MILFTDVNGAIAEECTVPHDSSSRNLAKLSSAAVMAMGAVGMCSLSWKSSVVYNRRAADLCCIPSYCIPKQFIVRISWALGSLQFFFETCTL